MAREEILTNVKGVKDILPAKAMAWRLVEAVAQDIFELYNFREVRTPIFERTEVFSRSIGETTDIVSKEMYTFTDRGGESLTLRPEGTASVVRSYIEHKMYNPPGITKLFYFGPMFRAERPQAGRFRQFHQIGAEIFGSSDPAVDAELVIMLMDFFSELKVTGLKIVLNSLGCPECRPSYKEALLKFLKERETELCDNCRTRIDMNPLRALDCKSTLCKKTTEDAPTLDNYLCGECKDHFNGMRRPLLDLELPVIVDPKLVRGLDYYSRTAFEITSENLGAQNAVAGGGRYDKLVERLGGPPTPAIGFAIGMERLIDLVDIDSTMHTTANVPDVFMLLMNDEANEQAFEIAHRLRSFGYKVDRSFDGGNMKRQMKKADRSGARFALILGDEEILSQTATLRDMVTGVQKKAALNDLPEVLDDLLGEQENVDPN